MALGFWKGRKKRRSRGGKEKNDKETRRKREIESRKLKGSETAGRGESKEDGTRRKIKR